MREPLDCAQEIIEKLEEHGITAYELDALLDAVRDMALRNAPIKAKRRYHNEH